MSHANISIFVPHLGCPNMCSFCDQRSITGTVLLPDADTIKNAVSDAKESPSYDSANTEIAFFGGSFTCIDREYMLSLLETASAFVKSGDVSGIRISTRPDGITNEILEVLRQYNVTAIELGAQSMCDDVLVANNRGHLASDVIKASSLIKSYGFELGLQMMTGLYNSSYEKDIETAKEIINISPKTVRIYPTITLKNTLLSELYDKGDYKPDSVDKTVDLCAKLLELFKKANISVIRLGLHSIDKSSYVAGPWHQSFGELVSSKIFLKDIKNLLENKPKGQYVLKVNSKDVSKVIGQKRANLQALKSEGYILRVVQSDSVLQSQFELIPERMN